MHSSGIYIYFYMKFSWLFRMIRSNDNSRVHHNCSYPDHQTDPTFRDKVCLRAIAGSIIIYSSEDSRYYICGNLLMCISFFYKIFLSPLNEDLNKTLLFLRHIMTSKLQAIKTLSQQNMVHNTVVQTVFLREKVPSPTNKPVT